MKIGTADSMTMMPVGIWSGAIKVRPSVSMIKIYKPPIKIERFKSGRKAIGLIYKIICGTMIPAKAIIPV